MIPDEHVSMPVAASPAIHEPDQYQRAVIASRERSIRVLAPAGSGKTETLARRVGALIESGVPARRILILTFDNQAKVSFQRSLQRLGVTGNVEIRTLNAFGLRILTELFPGSRSRTDRSFYGPSEPLLAKFMEQTDQASLIELFGTLKSHLFDPQKPRSAKLEPWIERNYSQLVPEKFLKDNPADKNAAAFSKELRREFLHYEAFLEHRNIIDFDDQKLRALTLLQGNPDAATRVQRRYAEIIVDEFQDINPLDQKLIELISREASLVITGDDDQAIYGFRWASADYLIRPKPAFKRTFTSFELETNYRCPEHILERAKQLIEHNRDRVRKHPKSGVDAEGSIVLIESVDRLAESQQIAAMIGETVANDPSLGYGDISVLTRRNQYLDEIQVQLISRGIPYAIKSDRDLIRTWATALDLLDLSTALRGREPVTDLRIAIANFKWFPRAVKIDQIQHFDGLDLQEVLASLQAGAPAHTVRKFESALALLGKGRSVDDELGVIESDFMGYEPNGGASRNRSPEEEAIRESPFELLRQILGRKTSTREQAIERLRGFILRATEANAVSGPKVELSTYHSAKGRQWTMVFLPFVSSRSVPDPLTRAEFGELEAERRLFYVAMTRSAKTLVAGYPSPASKEWPSRFLYESGILARPVAEPKSRSSSSRASLPSAPGHVEAMFGTIPNTGTTERFTQIERIESFMRSVGKRQGIKVAYGESPELVYPLQLALLLAQVPYRVNPDHDLLYSWIFRDVYKHITKSRLRIIRVTAEPEYPAFREAFTSMIRLVDARRFTAPKAKAALDTAIALALEQRKTITSPIVDFVQAS
jgi:superfamily I DNA/RNA helicase